MDDYGDGEPGGRVYQALCRELATMPEALRDSAEAMAALELARSIDQGPDTYRFQAALVRELRESMESLRAKAPKKPEGDTADELRDARARRRAKASGQ